MSTTLKFLNYIARSKKHYSAQKGFVGLCRSWSLVQLLPNSETITKQEIDLVNQLLAENGIMPENTRVEKKSDSEFIVHVASSETTNKTTYYQRQIDIKG